MDRADSLPETNIDLLLEDLNMLDNGTSKASWGTYAPPQSANFFRSLVKLGLARGVLGKWIRRQWHRKFPELVDVEIRGIKYRLDISDNTTDEKILLSSKNYDGEEIDALAIRGGKVFVDIGANTGYYSLALAKRGFEKIISIEPNPPTVTRLAFNVAINNLRDKVRVIPLCVGKEGKVEFYCDGSLGAASLICENNQIEPIVVDAKPLHEILQTENVKHIDSMKIDVEGFEDKALVPFFDLAPKELWPKVLVLEHCHRDIWESDILEYLLEGKYELVKKTRANSIMKKIV